MYICVACNRPLSNSTHAITLPMPGLRSPWRWSASFPSSVIAFLLALLWFFRPGNSLIPIRIGGQGAHRPRSTTRAVVSSRVTIEILMIYPVVSFPFLQFSKLKPGRRPFAMPIGRNKAICPHRSIRIVTSSRMPIMILMMRNPRIISP